MMHQGARPTFGESGRNIEVHLLDVDVDLYGQAVKLSWRRRLRDVRSFDTTQALKAQLDKDLVAARAALTPLRSLTSH
jgi:riboflavin kinase/FMN adenylyltransferase